MNSFFQLEGVLSAGWDGWTLGTLGLNIWGATMVDAEPKFEIEEVKNIWNYDKILWVLDDRYYAFWDVKLFQDCVFGVWLRTDFLPIWTSEAFKLLFSFTLGGLHLMLPKKMLPNAPIQLWNFWQNNFFLRSSMQPIIAASFWIHFCSFLSVMFLELTAVPVNRESFLNCPSVVFSMISYRWSTKILFRLIWHFELLAGDIFG